MASSGSITTNEVEGRSLTLSWTLSSQSVEKNTSTISWTLSGSGSASGYVKSGGFKAVINGVTVYSVSTDNRIELRNGTTVASGNATIAHNADGTKSFSLSCEAGIYTYAISATASGTHTLTTIPRASTISASNVDMGSATTITITRASSSFTHTDLCIWQCYRNDHNEDHIDFGVLDSGSDSGESDTKCSIRQVYHHM